MGGRIRRELKTLETMVHMYCQSESHGDGTLCDECADLLSYSTKRLESCRFKEKKKICGKCTVHCYKDEYRQRIRLVMRTVGPKMLYRHPVMLLGHAIDMLRY
jgi:predicted amidophosphoribosyltransferase